MLGLFGEIDDLLKSKPFHVTDTGIDLWIHRALTQYARRKELEDVVVCLSRDKENKCSLVVFENQQPVFETQKVEDIAVHLDIMFLNRQKSK